ncbi:MAG TPA: MFS transporter [Brevefilum fermentans]|jgi:MFS family permease|nr:MFS transporter [Brevefilum fermentans]HQA28579.1 MFS transporter [Brevefilum fermentans]
MRINQLRDRSVRIRHTITRFTRGGAWAAVLSASQQHNLTLFFYDGLFSAASDKIILTYLTIYLLSLGITRQQIGFLSSISSFSNALLLLPAAFLVERSGRRKEITTTSAIISRLMVFLMALLPFFLLGTSALVWIMLALVIIREAANNFAYPGWIALIGDIVPIEGRGRYFGSRNFIMGLAGMLVTLLMGEFITRIGEPLGYQVAFLVATLLAVFAIFFFNRIEDPLAVEKVDRQPDDAVSASFLDNLLSIFSSFKKHNQFLRFIIFVAVWNFTIQISGPFFTVHMAETLHFTAAMIGVVAVTNTAANMLVQRQFGLLADKWGDRTVSIVLAFLIPLVPLIWGLWVKVYWHAIAVEILSGLLWGGFNLVHFNSLLTQTPEDQRARFSAYYQIIVTLSMALGAAFGSFLIPVIEFVGVTLASTIGRLIAAVIFLVLVKETSTLEQTSPD